MVKNFICSLLILIGLFYSFQLNASNSILNKKSDSLTSRKIKEAPKTGYNLAPFPEFMISPEVGVYVGIDMSLFDFGKGERYPNYDQLFNINAAWGTKGKTNFSLKYKKFGKQIYSVKLSYSNTSLFPFYGFNGYQTYYNEDYQTITSPDYITSAFYNFNQKKTRVDFSIQDRINNSDFYWLIGTNIGYYNIDRVNFSKLNKNAEGRNIIIDAPTLYDRYVDWQLINHNEKDGGWANSFRGALLFDTRNQLTNPTKGVWVQATTRLTPELLGNKGTALQLGIKHHQYITLLPNRISFAYRLRYDATFGNLAFYSKHILADGTKGYGGASGMVGEGFGTIWGVHQNRVIGKQMALGNFEVRAKIIHFRFLKQNIHLSLVPLFHTGVILEAYPMNMSNISAEDQETFFRSSYKGWYSSLGIGGKLVLNENIAMGIDWARALNEEAGSDALYVGLGYTF